MPEGLEGAEVELACEALEESLAFYEGLGFRLLRIAPAEDPQAATLEGYGLRLRLQRGGEGGPAVLRLRCRDVRAAAAALGAEGDALSAPEGTRVLLVEASPPLTLPPAQPALVVQRGGEGAWGRGRAGMRYRDLLPGRWGGRCIASHIRIPEGGPVPDYVHYHEVRFQLIHCYRGWVRLVYEDQGPPFVLEAGDCVLQPPGIRHRVLECSPGLEVVELGSPAAHDTCRDHDLTLPTGALRPEREFGGQRFARSRAAEARWGPWRAPGFEARDTGLGEASAGVGEVRLVRPAGSTAEPASWSHAGELWWAFVLAGEVTLEADGRREPLAAGDAVALPPGLSCRLARPSPDLELLEVALGEATGPGA